MYMHMSEEDRFETLTIGTIPIILNRTLNYIDINKALEPIDEKYDNDMIMDDEYKYVSDIIHITRYDISDANYEHCFDEMESCFMNDGIVETHYIETSGEYCGDTFIHPLLFAAIIFSRKDDYGNENIIKLLKFLIERVPIYRNDLKTIYSKFSIDISYDPDKDLLFSLVVFNQINELSEHLSSYILESKRGRTYKFTDKMIETFKDVMPILVKYYCELISSHNGTIQDHD